MQQIVQSWLNLDCFLPWITSSVLCLMCTRRSAPALADPRSKSASREPSRAPCREAVDQRSGTRGSVEVVQLDDPLEAGLQVAILFEHPLILGADGLLDSDDLAAGRTVGFRSGGGAGCCRCVGPVLEYRLGPLQLPHGADDGHDLDGSAALPQRFPEAAMCHGPRAERLEGGHLLRLGREPRQLGMIEHVVEREAAARMVSGCEYGIRCAACLGNNILAVPIEGELE